MARRGSEFLLNLNNFSKIKKFPKRRDKEINQRDKSNQISNCAIVSGDQFHQEMEVIFRDNYLSNSYQHLWINSFRDDNFEQVK